MGAACKQLLARHRFLARDLPGISPVWSKQCRPGGDHRLFCWRFEMKDRQKFQLLSFAAAVILLLYPQFLWGQRVRPAEVNLQGANLAEIQDRMSGPNGLLNQNQPFELKAQNVVLTQEQAQSFFAPQTPTSGTDFATLVGKIQQLPGTEVRIRGVVEAPGPAGGVQRLPFDAKV